jgi:hypothetical protein
MQARPETENQLKGIAVPIELAISPMECQIDTQSAPDAIDLPRIVTLVCQSYVKSLRHGIYEHQLCARAVADWVRAQLEAAVPVESR